jgi:hypothetical protein
VFMIEPEEIKIFDEPRFGNEVWVTAIVTGE